MAGVAALVLLLFVGGLGAGQECVCREVAEDEGTRWGGNEIIAVVEPDPVRRIRGSVVQPDGQPICDALVEVFLNPGWIVDERYEEHREPRARVAACLTDSAGRYCVGELPDGAYEVRFSLDEAWNPVHVAVTVERGSAGAGEAHLEEVALTPGG